MSSFEAAQQLYSAVGVDVDLAISTALNTPISVHCWQSDDVHGFEVHDSSLDSGGIMATGSYPGRARNISEVRADLDQVFSLVPGSRRVNLHAIYADSGGQPVDRSELTIDHFSSWVDWALQSGLNLDFNPTYFAHPKAACGFTLSNSDGVIREYWIKHGLACRQIAAAIADRQGGECVNNHWIPDGAKDSPANRWTPRALLQKSLDELLQPEMPGCVDAVESKLFGLGSEDYVVGSFEFYSQYALSRSKLLCLDMGHFHPTEGIADKLSALLQFQGRLLLHVSRPVRWDSDHVVLFNDDLRAVFLELTRGKALDKVSIALDYFDASINRVAAYVIGIRATRKAILYALLDPVEELQDLERKGKLASKLALMEEVKTMPFGVVWDELCASSKVPVGRDWMKAVENYEEQVLSRRG